MSEVYVNVNGTWKQASNYYVNVNGTWKEGSEIHTKVIALTAKLSSLLDYLDASSSWSYPRTGTTWINLAGTSNFTLNGATFFSSNGGCIDFDGTDDYAEKSGRLFNTGGSFSVSAWVYSDSFSGTNGYTIISNYNSAEGFQLRYKTGSGLQILKSTSSTLGTFTGSTLSAENWYNITVTFNNSTDVYTLYINGSSVSTITSSVNFAINSDPDTIGANHSSTSEYWNGKIAQVFSFDGAKDASEVLANYNATKSNYTIITTNLVLHLDAANNSSYSGSGTTWTDLSTSTNNGTLTNGPTYSSDFGGVIVFDGTNDYVQTSSIIFNPNANFTFSIWVNADALATDTPYVFIGNINNNGSFMFRYRNGIQIVDSGVLINGTFSSSTLSTNIWYNLTITRTISGSTRTYTLFIDGSSISSFTDGNDFDYGSSSIGTKYTSDGSGSQFFDGKIGQVFAYTSALTASEISQNYNATKLKYTIITTNLVLHLDTTNLSSYSGSGTAWNDLSGQGNNATLVNSPTYSSSDGGYLSFDGSNDYATLPNMDLTGNELTFSIWTLTQSNTAASLIFLGDSTASSGNGRIINVHLPHTSAGGRYFFDKGYDGSSYDRIYNSLANSDWQSAWVNWSFTANASTGSMKVYRNGSLFDSGTGKTKTFSNSDGDMKYIAYSGSNYYHGDISKILLYKKELTASEVLHNYNIDKAIYGH